MKQSVSGLGLFVLAIIARWGWEVGGWLWMKLT